MRVLPESVVRRVIETQRNERSHFYHRRPIVKSAGKCLDKTDRNFGTRQEKTDRNVGNAHFFIPIFFTMTGRGRGGGSRGGRGGERGGCGRGRGQNYTGARTVAKSGLCAALGDNVFDYGCRAAVDQMRTSWEKLIQFVGTNYGQDISNELQNKIPVILSEPVHTPEVLARHAICEQMV